MAVTLPAVTAWPGLVPEQSLEPGQDHFSQDVGALAEEQHFLAAYFGAGHVAQEFGALWDGTAGAGLPLCRSTVAATVPLPLGVNVLTYLIRQRRHAQKLVAVARCKAPDGGTVTIEVYDDAAALLDTLTLTFAASATPTIEWDLTAAIGRGDLISRIEVHMMTVAGPGDPIDLLGFYLADADLAVGDLP